MKRTPEIERQMIINMLPNLEYHRTRLKEELEDTERQIKSILHLVQQGLNGHKPDENESAPTLPLLEAPEAPRVKRKYSRNAPRASAPPQINGWYTISGLIALVGYRLSSSTTNKFRRKVVKNPGKGRPTALVFHPKDVEAYAARRQGRPPSPVAADLPVADSTARIEVGGLLTKEGACQVLGKRMSFVERAQREGKLTKLQVPPSARAGLTKQQMMMALYDPAEVHAFAKSLKEKR